MIGFWKSLSGIYEVELITATPEERLWEINNGSIAVFHVSYISQLCIRFQIRRKDYRKLKRLCDNKGDTLTICRNIGIFYLLSAAAKRPVLAAGICMLLFLTWFLPTRILFIRVEGNERISQNEILEEVSHCGMSFWTVRRNIRSEQVKNSLLQRMPSLEWVGVNTYGCVAVISVREALDQNTPEKRDLISNVVAVRDGVVLECTATKGNLLCRPGEVVRKDQILISGYTDCGRIIQAGNAEGEIYARTIRRLRTIKPLQHREKGSLIETGKQFSLILGKKRINLWKDSGIWDSSCGRMYREYVLTLPGGFQLPAAWCMETITRNALSDTDCLDTEISDQLPIYAEEYLLQQMNAGRIQTGKYQIVQDQGIAILEGSYICTEMIGRIQPEQIGEENGKTD